MTVGSCIRESLQPFLAPVTLHELSCNFQAAYCPTNKGAVELATISQRNAISEPASLPACPTRGWCADLQGDDDLLQEVQGQVDVLGLTQDRAQDAGLADALGPGQVHQVHLGALDDLLPDLPLHPSPSGECASASSTCKGQCASGF